VIALPYNPAEPRDWRGRWTNGGGFPLNGPIHDAAYNGKYHDQVVDWIKGNLGREGVRCVKSVRLTTVNGTTAIPDLVCLSPEDGTLSIVEIKTGENPIFTPNQAIVYAMAQFDNHVISSSSKLEVFGMPAGTPMLSMKVDVVYARAPGVRLKFSQPFEWYRENMLSWIEK
jgi:hypothetical protein